MNDNRLDIVPLAGPRLAGPPAGRVPAWGEKRGPQAGRLNGRRRVARRQRGMIFIIALAVTVILAAMMLVYAQEMRSEGLASANRVSEAQAASVELGAEQWTLAQVETFTTPLSGSTGQNNVGFGDTDIAQIPAAGLKVGNGYFWLLNPDPDNDQNYRYGIVDENAKINIGAATADQLILLPNVTQEAADSMVDWCDADENVTGSDGGESDYYLNAVKGEPYSCKDGPLDTVDELLLVKGVTPAMLYGMDLNRDGVVTDAEAQLAAGAAQTNNVNGSNDRRGFVNYVTAYTTRAIPNSPAPVAAPGQIVQKTIGLININTAPEAVLMCLPGISQSDADTLVSTRSQQAVDGSTTTTTWAQNALGNAKWQAIAPYVTARTYQYSADIVAVSGDGRSFRRVRLVIDARTQPAKILYRKDVTDLGWPLSPDIRTSLRAGKGLPDDAAPADNGWSTGATSGGF
jgi:type II secretory pathway component PulK